MVKEVCYESLCIEKKFLSFVIGVEKYDVLLFSIFLIKIEFLVGLLVICVILSFCNGGLLFVWFDFLIVFFFGFDKSLFLYDVFLKNDERIEGYRRLLVNSGDNCCFDLLQLKDDLFRKMRWFLMRRDEEVDFIFRILMGSFF